MPITWEKSYVIERSTFPSPWDEYELHPTMDWGFGFADDSLSVMERDGCDVPFSSENPSVVLKAKLDPVEWNYVDGYAVAKTLPESNKATGSAREVLLHPYGATMLRLTEMPMSE